MKPNFIFVGAGRSGSTWVYECLKEHPDVLLPAGKKEIHFFNNRDGNYGKGVAWYEDLFEPHRGETAVGEVTPSYLGHPETAKRIHQHYPDVRLVMSLRNPVERAYSSYVGYLMNGLVKDGEGVMDASERLAAFPQFSHQASIIEHGLYYRHITEFLKYFDREKVKIMIFDDLKADPRSFISEIYRFLGIDDSFRPSVLDHKVNKNVYSGHIRLLNRVGRIFEPIAPRIQHAIEVFGRKLRNKLVKTGPAAMDVEMRKELIEYYRDDIHMMSNLLNRDLSCWLK